MRTPTAAWSFARESVDAGEPILLLTDLYYLDHYGRSAHFPGHAVVLAGYDDETAYVSDTAFEELQKTSIASLREARHGDHPAFALKGHAFTVAETPTRDDLLEVVPAAIKQAAQAMLEPEWGEFAGIPAVRRLAAEAQRWPHDAEDWKWCARFGYQVIERRGTGGGNFRLMYSRFLEEAGTLGRGGACSRGGAELDGAGRGASRRERGRGSRARTVGAGGRVRRWLPQGRGAALGVAGLSSAGDAETREVADPSAESLLAAQARSGAAALQRPERDVVRVAHQLADDEAAAGPQDPGDLSERAVTLRDLAEHRGEDDRVDAVVLKGQRRLRRPASGRRS